ncbi:MAG: YdcF family protein [Lachnospiraceae bacterium]|nr:YdcF family protein [Lachnospiraceae bacterium]
MHRTLQDIANFIFLEDQPEQADLIMVCGSARIEPARRAAELYHAGFATRVLPTGRYGEQSADLKAQMRKLAANDGADPEEIFARMEQEAKAVGKPFPETEWEYQRNTLLAAGVPEEAILKEDRSRNTFENAVFARELLLKEDGRLPATMILCCQAFHARRALMTLSTEFPDTRILVCPAVTRGLSRETCWDTAAGYDKVMQELEKCGTYFRGEKMYRKTVR